MEYLEKIVEEFDSLDVLTYEKIVDLLNDQERHTMIWFTSFKNCLGNRKEYHYVQVMFADNDKQFCYKSPDQNDKLIEKNLYRALSKSPIEGNYYFYVNEWCEGFMCIIGKNKVDFPNSVAKRIAKEFEERQAVAKQEVIELEPKKLMLNISDPLQLQI
jgi:hypothetical protein